MRKKQRERPSDFGRDESGKIAYLGDHVRLAAGHDRRRLLVTLWAACGTTAAAVLGASLANPGGLSGCPYVVVPYVVEFVATVSVVWGMCRLSAAGERMRAYVRDETVGALPRRALVAAVAALACAAGEVVLLVLGAQAPGAAELVFFACQALAVVALAVLRRTCLATSWESA